MPAILPVIAEVAHHMALVPAVWLGLRRDRRHVWWGVAGALGVSWLADTAAHWVDPSLVSGVYPVAQSAIIGLVILEREEVELWLVTLLGVGFMALAYPRPDLLLHTVAWLGIAGVAMTRPSLGPVRYVLALAFGLAWLGWLGYVLNPGWTTWGAYQSLRAIGLGVFCWASLDHQSMRWAEGY